MLSNDHAFLIQDDDVSRILGLAGNDAIADRIHKTSTLFAVLPVVTAVVSEPNLMHQMFDAWDTSGDWEILSSEIGEEPPGEALYADT